MNRFLSMLVLFLLFATACQDKASTDSEPTPQIRTTKEQEAAFATAMRKHLDAVENRDINALQSTMSPDGKLFFILDKRPLTTTSKAFMDFHREWFKDSSWTISFKILHTEVADSLGIAITESIYREPDRDGKAYYHKMHVSYSQEKINDQWYVIMDQAVSLEKSTDIE